MYTILIFGVLFFVLGVVFNLLWDDILPIIFYIVSLIIILSLIFFIPSLTALPKGYTCVNSLSIIKQDGYIETLNGDFAKKDGKYYELEYNSCKDWNPFAETYIVKKLKTTSDVKFSESLGTNKTISEK